MYFFCVIDLGSFSFSLLPLEIIVGVIMLGLAALWVFDKLTDMLGMYQGDGEYAGQWDESDEEHYRE